jgi:hypothetical protein
LFLACGLALLRHRFHQQYLNPGRCYLVRALTCEVLREGLLQWCLLSVLRRLCVDECAERERESKNYAEPDLQ